MSDTNTISIPELRAIYPQLIVTDVAATAADYRDVLGFRIKFLLGEPPSYDIISQSN